MGTNACIYMKTQTPATNHARSARTAQNETLAPTSILIKRLKENKL
jgi:hypothetical protein